MVTDTNDEPLIGATVLVKGTQNGTVTDVDGRFHLKVNSGETLVVSYIGMKSKEVAVVDVGPASFDVIQKYVFK